MLALTALRRLDTRPGMSVGLIIAMPLRQWGLIDVCMDDDAGVETVEGNTERAESARCIRRAGWDQITSSTAGPQPLTAQGVTKPPLKTANSEA